MEKNESRNKKRKRNRDLDNNNMNIPSPSLNSKDKSLPWWVELFFVQIGLPDKILIKILRSKKNFKEFIKNDKKVIFSFLFFLAILIYFFPVIKMSKNKLNCETTANKYIKKSKNLVNISKKELNMLSTNFCNGGEELDKI